MSNLNRMVALDLRWGRMMMPLDLDGQNDLGHIALAGGADVHQPARMAGRHGPTDEPARAS
jgi:hypothetical protein